MTYELKNPTFPRNQSHTAAWRDRQRAICYSIIRSQPYGTHPRVEAKLTPR